ncbi:hypothetical protein EKO27_g4030 [Xylaria grammica]|uniref:Uncharacterized protein n=1 Tax=Xylaria grammica TaxID=363999 RepID=A0A439D9I4_9PEZI|nr:hypothetical protein F5X98DRAFT_260971 [Xylaria grammica]RWA11070.1 hypothetical protein EKO27_g4030 [Xylaria grammica]GAW17032.1 hypothetical protein ANO14919_064810 [Xylariales sp. No.14919]
MRAGILLTALMGASSASASVMRIAADSMEYDWAVTGWSAGCARSGCYYDFNVTGVQNLTQRPATPAFKAYCSGFGEGAPYRLCDRLDEEDTDAIVVAKLLPSNITANGTRSAIIQVSLKYTDLETPTTWWNFTGHAASFYNQFSAPLQNFTITPSEIIGVA